MIAIFTKRELLDIAFLNLLNETLPDLEISFFGVEDEINFGAKIKKIYPLETFMPEKFKIVINFIKEYDIQNYDGFYLNFKKGKISLNSNEKNVLIPHFTILPILNFLSIIKDHKFKNLNIFTNQSIAELGKLGMNEFYKEIKASSMRIMTESSQFNEPLAFNIINQLGSIEENLNSVEENLIIKQIQQNFEEKLDIMVSCMRVSSNKTNSIVLNFELEKEISLESLKKKINLSEIVYIENSISTIKLENDDAIYLMRLKKFEKKYSVVLSYDEIRITVLYINDFLQNFLKTKN